MIITSIWRASHIWTVFNHTIYMETSLKARFTRAIYRLPGDSKPRESQMRRTLFGGYLFKYCSVKYQTFHYVSEKTSQQTYSYQKTTSNTFQMPPRAIKHQLTCPIELTSGSFRIGRRGILVIPRNRLV